MPARSSGLPGLPGKMGTRGAIRDSGSTAAKCSTTCGYHTIKDLQIHEQGYDELTCRRVVKHNHRPQRAKSSTMIPAIPLAHRNCPLAPCICISFLPRTMRIHHHAIHCCSQATWAQPTQYPIYLKYKNRYSFENAGIGHSTDSLLAVGC